MLTHLLAMKGILKAQLPISFYNVQSGMSTFAGDQPSFRLSGPELWGSQQFVCQSACEECKRATKAAVPAKSHRR